MVNAIKQKYCGMNLMFFRVFVVGVTLFFCGDRVCQVKGEAPLFYFACSCHDCCRGKEGISFIC